MPSSLVVLAVAAAAVAAVRSTWSPCALSMLSTLTPLAERARGHRFATTAAWYVAGATAGGATLGAGAAVLAALVATIDLSVAVRAGIVAVAAIVGGLSDARLGGLHLPAHTRQVDERWIGNCRRWVYAGGFGWQVGAGVVTYITTACVYVTVVAAAMLADPLAAFAVCVGFGAARGLAILLAVPLRDLATVSALHARLDRWSEPSLLAAAAAQLAIGAGAAALAGLAPPLAVVAGGAGVTIVAVVGGMRQRPASRAPIATTTAS